MPKEFDRILEGVKRSLSGKINPRTKKPYTESEIYAIATEQYKKKKKSFSLFTPVVNHWEEKLPVTKDAIEKGKGEDKQRFIQVTVTGLKEDRDGERISQEAIEDMILQYKSGTVPLFPNHGRDPVTGERVYNWQEIMGVWVDAEQKEDNVLATARLNKAHPDSDKLWQYIKEGMPIGFSIGGITEDYIEEVEE